jgi:hypothetical protein
VTWLLAALLIPTLFWDKGPDSADTLRKAQIHDISVPASIEGSWKDVSGFSVEAADPTKMVKVPAPDIQFRRNRASATAAPWVDSNGWRFIRQPGGTYYYDAPGKSAALAAAEAFTYGVHAAIHTDADGLQPFGEMLAFLEKIDLPEFPALANIGFVDDGSPEAGEVMNLLVRRNLLFTVVHSPDPKLDLTVKLGSPEYPKSEAANPSMFAEKVRSKLTDEKRLLRLYGSDLVVGRLVGNGNSAKLFLLNYGASRTSVEGLRIRVLGGYSKYSVLDFGLPQEALLDATKEPGASEFTLKELKVFAVISLTR